MDYLDFYELNQEPFSNAPVSRFYYDSAQHSQALVRLMYALGAIAARTGRQLTLAAGLMVPAVVTALASPRDLLGHVPDNSDYFISNRDRDAKLRLQQFLQENLLSSHLRGVARRPVERHDR